MRFIYLLLLLVFVAAIGIFAFQNSEKITLQYLNSSIVLPLSLVIVGVYVLGMFTGWTVVGIVRRSYQRAIERRE